ncbi:conserved hypothetical cytosolic protein [Hippea maritima DSM 10411]|uniref:Conserved hypothetical cytosolic protein n=2 Tax=Hippea TaxID=84404 RepID=F2LV35_HIPMA|nr:conserved hypothetical cytosolic protein [Hippea maritima DSM 10411]
MAFNLGRAAVRAMSLTAALFVLVIAVNSSQACVNLGTYGATWPIKEQDALKQILSGLKHYNYRKILNKQVFTSAFHRYEERLSTDLPRSKKHKIYTVDMTYTLPFDIRDAKGRIIYPRGYKFNPLDYIKVPFVYVIINGNDKKQVSWFMHSKYYNKVKSMLLICKGDVITLEKKIKMPVFYADKRIIKKFNLKVVPSIAYQKEDKFYVEEIPLPDNSTGNHIGKPTN